MKVLRSLSVIALSVASCNGAMAPSVQPTASGAPASVAPTAAAPTATSAPTGTPAPTTPPGTVAWPATFDIEVDGTYWSRPPFTIGFAITIDEPGWFSGHLHPTFIDLQRFDGITPHRFPNRMLGFGDPDHVRGGNGDVDVTTLTPDAALDLLAGRASLTTSNHVAQALFGIDGARMDLHSATNSNPLFGDAGGNFGLGPQLDLRLVLVPRGGRFLVIAVLAAPGDLDAAWEEALPILATVDLGPLAPS